METPLKDGMSLDRQTSIGKKTPLSDHKLSFTN